MYRDRFAQRIFFQRFVVVLIYLILFTFTTVMRQTVCRIHDLTDMTATVTSASSPKILSTTNVDGTTIVNNLEDELAQLAALKENTYAYFVRRTYATRLIHC